MANQYQYQSLGGSFNPPQPLLYYEIHGRPAFSYGNIQVQPNQKVLVDGTAMLWMDGSLNLETECYGGCEAACMRSCAGESCCMNTYSGAGKVTVGFDMPGDMLSFGVAKDFPWLITQAAFVAGTENLKVSSRFSGCAACCCTEEGPFLSTVEIDPESQTDQGVFLAGSYGFLERHDVPEGKTLFVARGCFFAARKDTTIEVGCVGGLPNYCCGAGGKAFIMKFHGPCTVYTQSRNPKDLKRLQTMGKKEAEQKDNEQQQQQGGGDE